MKKNLLYILCFVLSIGSLRAQFFTGLRSSPYGGITNINYNPAIADSRFIADINLLSVGMSVNNNYVGVDKRVLLNKIDTSLDFQSTYLRERINGRDKNAYVGMQIQGPLSFMFSWGKNQSNKNAFGFSYHYNGVTNLSNVDETFARIAYYGVGYTADSATSFRGKVLKDANASVKTMQWIDYGLTYSRVVYDKGDHMVKVGGTLKLLQGVAGGYMYVKDLNYKWENYDTLDIFQTEVDYKYSEGAISSRGYETEDLKDYAKELFSFKYAAPSVAVDLGVIYEWRPKKDKYKYQMDCKEWWRLDQNRYVLSAGFSVIDFGAINFKKGQYSGNFNADIEDWNVGDAEFPDGLQSIDDTIRTRFQVTDDGNKTFRMWLPTRFNVFLDYNIAYGFGLNLNATISPNMAPKRNMVTHVTSFTFTPKYDHAWFGAYLPLTYDVMGNFSFGTTLRMGPVIIGTQDLLSLFAKKNTYNADVHIGLKIPIPYGKKRDRDKDGVSNSKDLCKKEMGNCASMGCPDRDGDGITDSEDKCPDEAGPVELQGCPDMDRDGISDRADSCVSDSGLVEFNGCPDRDGDKVIDKKDECPDTPGLVELNGCPDRDGDGVADKIDLCPDVPGDKTHFGCPDTDGDGVYDNEDRCIQVKGPKENIGCPWPDGDNDGVFDKDDECPKVPGVAANKGCPALEKKEIDIIRYAFENLEFETGKDIIRTKSYPSLTALANLLVQKKNYGLRIEGHTDNVGSDENNLILSQKRANAVRNYMVKKGVDATKLESFGYGESMPIADNATTAGKQKNRRVEMKIVFR